MSAHLVSLVDISQDCKSKVTKFKSGALNEFLRFEELPLDILKLVKEYQRDIGWSEINNQYKQFDRRYCVAVIVAKRPDGEYVVVDGQHKVLMAIWSEQVTKIPCMVLEHESNATIEQCESIEAELFHALNAKRKNPNYVDKMRAGYIFKLSEAVEYNNNLSACRVYVENLGDVEGHQLNGEYQWRQAIKKYELKTVISAVEYAKQFDKTWNRNEVRGDIVYGLSALLNFLENGKKELNGRVQKVIEFMLREIPKKKVKVWYDGISGSKTDILIARRIIQAYKDSSSTSRTNSITEETLTTFGLQDPILLPKPKPKPKSKSS